MLLWAADVFVAAVLVCALGLPGAALLAGIYGPGFSYTFLDCNWKHQLNACLVLFYTVLPFRSSPEVTNGTYFLLRAAYVLGGWTWVCSNYSVK